MNRSVYLIRHATPDWSRVDLPYHLPPGPALTEQGINEAQGLGDFLSREAVRILFCSPLERCLATARIVSSKSGAEIIVSSRLKEWQPGEDATAIRNRVRPIFKEASLITDWKGAVGLVTHGGPIAMLMRSMGMQEEELLRNRIFDRGNPLPPAGVWRADKAPDAQAWTLDFVYNPNGVAGRR